MDNSKSYKSRANILLVDDDFRIHSALTRSLTLLGFRADAAGSGREALDKLAQGDYNVMVLDLKMPGMSGVETMHRVLEMYPDMIILILTAHATLDSAIAAVKAGAVDYLRKPVSIHDLAAAISSALERQAPDVREMSSDLASVTCEVLTCGPVTLNKEALWVAVDGMADGYTVRITVSEADVLACLLARPHQVLSCQDLARAALGYDVSVEEARKIVRPHISRLRNKLGEEDVGSQLIETIVGKGYVFRPESLGGDQ